MKMYSCFLSTRTNYSFRITLIKGMFLLKGRQGHLPTSLQHSGRANQQDWWRGLASEIYNADFLSTPLCVFFLFRHRVYTDNSAYSIPEICREQNENFCMRTHNSTAVLSSFLALFLFMRPWKPLRHIDYWILSMIIYSRTLLYASTLYSSSIFLKITMLMLRFLMSPHRIRLGWDMRQEWQWSIWGIKLLLACLNKQRSRRVAGGLVFGVTHTVYTTGFFCLAPRWFSQWGLCDSR